VNISKPSDEIAVCRVEDGPLGIVYGNCTRVRKSSTTKIIPTWWRVRNRIRMVLQVLPLGSLGVLRIVRDEDDRAPKRHPCAVSRPLALPRAPLALLVLEGQRHVLAVGNEDVVHGLAVLWVSEGNASDNEVLTIWA
jgi:hypothetical protein